MIKLMVEVPIFTWMELNIKEIGEKINNTDLVLRHGLMAQDMKVTMNTERNMEQELSSGLTVQCILENSIITIFTERVCIHGVMEESMKVNGEIIKCMEKVLLLGQMAENMLVNTLMIRNKDMENSFGLTEDVIKETGITGSNMVKEYM
jgi:hypothetical protein